MFHLSLLLAGLAGAAKPLDFGKKGLDNNMWLFWVRY